MGDNDNKSVVIALFSGADKADMAANQLKDWDWADESVSLGAIQIITNNEGKVESRNVAPRHTGGGAKWGAIAGVVAGVLSGGLTLIVGAIGGAVAGGALGALKKSGVKISEKDLQKVDQALKDGKAGLIVMCDENEMAGVEDMLKSTGALQTMAFALTADAISMFDSAANRAKETASDAANKAGDAVDSASDSASDAVDTASDAVQGAVDTTADAAHDAVDATADATKGAVAATTDAVQGAVDATSKAAKSATDAAADAVS